jgi:penicillin-binding protein 1C
MKTKKAQKKKLFKKANTKNKFVSSLKGRKTILIILITIVITSTFSWILWGLPLTADLTKGEAISTKLFDRNGKLIYEIFGDKRRTPVKLSSLPKYVWQATISIEDKDFYKHHGLSITGIGRAIYNIIFKKNLQGGSTLTQQLVKNSLLTPERTLKRKIRELILTLIVEARYSKDQILELYLNEIPYGGTAYGIEAASELYFNKSAKDLDLAEAAFLAGLPVAPSTYSPYGAHPELAKSREEAVLARMREDGYIGKDEEEKAKNEKLNFQSLEVPPAPHFALWVKEMLAQKYGESIVEKGGLRVTTTLDLDLQEYAQDAVTTEVARLKGQNVKNGAAVVTYPGTGEILALVGSKDYFASDEDGKVNIIFANRQPGSSIKPLNYALAIKDGKITASTPLADVPTCFEEIGQKSYCPTNYDNTFHGAIQARFALGNSYNIPAVRVLALNGVDKFINFAREMGITTFTDPSNYGLSLTLGGGEVTPYDMIEAYGVFANQGIKEPLKAILKVEDSNGKVLEENTADKLDGDRILDPKVTYIISHILLDNNARTAAFGEHSYLNVPGHPEVSVKTGTTNDRRDNWTIGYTSQIAALSWVGNNDNSPMSGAVSGISGASPIWNKIIKYALDKAEKGGYSKSDKGHAWPSQPEGIVGLTVCATNGSIPTDSPDPSCPTRFEYFLKDHMPQRIQGGNMDVQIDKTKGSLALPHTPPENIETQNHPVLLDPLGTIICLNCPLPTDPITIKYPL